MAKQRPLLVFPKPVEADRSKRSPSPSSIKTPPADRQIQRLEPQFKRVQDAFERHRASIQTSSLGIEPEQVLVIETIGPIQNFAKAVKKAGLEWLVETDIDDVQPDFGFEDSETPNKFLKGQLYLVMTDQSALKQFVGFFTKWKKNPELTFPSGLAPLRNAFRYLHTIRPWEAEDRIRETGILEDWQEREHAGQNVVPFEAELWFRNDNGRRSQAERYFRSVIESLDGKVETRCIVPEIRYHGILGSIPIKYVSEIVNRTDIRLIQCEDIMFLRPVGQSAFPIPDDAETESIKIEENASEKISSSEPPVAALLDGLPLAGHNLLRDRLIIDDPDDFESAYQADERVHGTAMASLICHDELDRKESPLPRKIYVRPILKPNRDFHGKIYGSVPEDVLTVDLIHRSVIRMLEGDDGEEPSAPEVRVINLSIGDRYKPLHREMSSLARLVDWLSWQYNVLFIVSAGNHSHNIELSDTREQFKNLSDEQRQESVIKAIVDDTRHRKLLSPAETINGVTVGSLHEDFSGVSGVDSMTFDPFVCSGLISVFSAHGSGYRRMVKPEVFFPGGKQILREEIIGVKDQPQQLSVTNFIRAPGQRVARGNGRGNLNDSFYSRGTSNSTALATRACCKLFDVIQSLRTTGQEAIPEEFDPVLLKTMLVHGSSWSNSFDFYERVLKTSTNSKFFKDYLAHFIGYGSADVSRVISCTDQRATVLGFGSLSGNEGHVFEFPLPPSLEASRIRRRLTISLCWFSPISSSRQSYRVAHLWFDPKNNFTPNRQECDWRAAQRGTVQHEIVQGDKAFAYEDGDKLGLRISCRADAGDIPSPVRYAIAVTLEVAENSKLPIYSEIQTRLKVPARQRINA